MKHNIITILGACATLGLAQAALAQETAAPAKQPGCQKHNPAEHFKKLDTDGNGSLNKEEFTARAAKAPDPAKATAHLEARFAKLDTNKDGVISLEEFLAGAAKRGHHRHGHGGNKPAAE